MSLQPTNPEQFVRNVDDSTYALLSIRITEAATDIELSQEQIDRSASIYGDYHDQTDEAIKTGLYGDELKLVLGDKSTVLLRYESDNGDVFSPLLVDASELEWYNIDVLAAEYPEATGFFYFAHPPIPDDDQSKEVLSSSIRAKLDQGAVVFTDSYIDDDGEPTEKSLGQIGEGYELVRLGKGEYGKPDKGAEVYAGVVQFGDSQSLDDTPTISEVFKDAVEHGELQIDVENGVELVDVIEAEEAERIWNLYKPPFDKLSKGNPMLAGFDKDSLLEILKDPGVAKIINKVDGVISTLLFFVDDFEQCPWFNKQFYEEHYPEYLATGNILMFPGIVTDEKMRGNDYSGDVINFALGLYDRVGSSQLVTFECTETSATYIPEIVEGGINSSAVAKITGIRDSISHMGYYAVSKAA